MKARITYLTGHSILHRLHPLAKGAWLLAGTILLFVIRVPWVILAVTALLVAAFPLARLPLIRLRGVRALVLTALLLVLLQVAFTRQGVVLARLGPLVLTRDGLDAGIYIAGRFVSVALLSYLYVLSTDPNDLAYALMRAGLPYRYGFALISALRMAPMFEQEGQIIYQAQLARGVRYDVRSPSRFLTLARQFFLPLLVSALGKADSLAVSMEGRCFGKYPTRTFLREVHWTWQDWVAMVVLVGVIVAATIGFCIG
jgi:energy-coupling factor transport system permease protein